MRRRLGLSRIFPLGRAKEGVRAEKTDLKIIDISHLSEAEKRPAWDDLPKSPLIKSVADKIQSKTGLGDDGSTLVDHALSGNPPMLAINTLATESHRMEQKGFANLLRGTFGMFRNPTAHEARIHWPMSKEDAEDFLSLVSLIHRRLDAAHMPARV